MIKIAEKRKGEGEGGKEGERGKWEKEKDAKGGGGMDRGVKGTLHGPSSTGRDMAH